MDPDERRQAILNILKAIDQKKDLAVEHSMKKFNPNYEKRDLEDVETEIKDHTTTLEETQAIYEGMLEMQKEIMENGTKAEIKTYWKVRRAVFRKIQALRGNLQGEKRTKKMIPLFTKMEAALYNLAGDMESSDDEILSDDASDEEDSDDEN